MPREDKLNPFHAFFVITQKQNQVNAKGTGVQRPLSNPMKTFRLMAFALAMAAMGLAVPACNSDEPDDPNKPEEVDPSKPTDDPVGTIVLRMRNDNETLLGDFIISPENNFKAVDHYGYQTSYIASIGTVAGLGNITAIPLTGWSHEMAVNPGKGYVQYNERTGKFYRMYVTEWMNLALEGGICGAVVKYQSPFYGSDDAITLESETVNVDGAGGSVPVWFTNNSFIPFSVSSDADWCRVDRATSEDRSQDFLFDGVMLNIESSNLTEATTATVTITADNGKETVLTVVRGAEEPFVYFSGSGNEMTVDIQTANEWENSYNIYTNVKSGLMAKSDSPWITAEIEQAEAAPQRRARYVEGREAEEVAAMSRADEGIRAVLRLKAEVNYSVDTRRARVTISQNGGKELATADLTQGGMELSLESEEGESGSAAGKSSFILRTNFLGTFKLTSSAKWCKPVEETLTITADDRLNIPPYDYRKLVTFEIEQNSSETARTAFLYVDSPDGKHLASYKVTQKGISFDNVPETVYFDRNAGNSTVTLPVTDIKTEISADWCSVNFLGSMMTIRVLPTSDDRTCTISFEGFDHTITIDQSKYAVGDTYDEDGVRGTVYLMDGAKCMLRSDNLGSAAYSTEKVLIGAFDENDGMKNMEIVKAIHGWKELYPAFALCDALNTDGVSGWYLPAVNEIEGHRYSAWSSTERNNETAYGTSWYGNLFKYEYKKQESKNVYAVHPFVKKP